MFLKFGDKNKTKSVEENDEICKKCFAKIIIINSKKECECNNDSFYKKSQEILHKKNNSTNSN